MDIYEYLKKDHEKVGLLLDRILGAASDFTRRRLFEEVRQELLLHVKTESATFYEALKRRRETRDRIDHAEKEHEEIEEHIAELSRLPIGGEKWIARFGEFKHCVLRHVEEEEGEVFDEARRALSPEEAERLAAEMDAMKRKRLRKAG
jgi:hemerythrin superfamily protein